MEIRKIEAAVHGRYCLVRALGQEGQVQVIGVAMNNVEIRCPAPHLIEHHQVIDKRILDPLIAPECHLAPRIQGCGGARIAAGEQCHLVPLPDQLFGQVGDDTLATTIEPRRTTFV